MTLLVGLCSSAILRRPVSLPKTECTDHLIVFNAEHLRRILASCRTLPRRATSISKQRNMNFIHVEKDGSVYANIASAPRRFPRAWKVRQCTIP
jgi:hypothetical protein